MKKNLEQRQLWNSEIPEMPAGYYSGDQPNPNLKAFVEQHLQERPYDPSTDDYDVPAFDQPIETTKATAIYNMHTYWSKKPHDAIRQYIRHYTQPGDLVLDPFCGSGGTALAALMEGRKAIAIDRSPAATFITKNYCTPVDVKELQKAFEELKRKVKPEIDWLYETRCDRCGGKATTAYTVYSQVFQCPRCLEKVPLFDCIEIESLTAQGKPKKIAVCPFCQRKGVHEVISTRAEKFGAMPVLVSYLCEGRCKPVRSDRRHNDPDPRKREYFERYDLAKIREIEAKSFPHWYPHHKMMNVEDDSKPWGAEWREGRNFRTVADLFTKRNLWALAAILGAAKQIESSLSDVFRFAVSSFLLNLSKLYKHREGGGGQPTGNYYIPQVNRENEAWTAFERKFYDLREAYNILSSSLNNPSIMISTDTCTRMKKLPDDSVDHIFTDPPYADKIQYGELNFIWESWLHFDTTWHAEEIIVNLVRGRSEEDWASMMRQAMSECFRVLKPGRWLSLCYHDTSEGTWSLVQDLMMDVGFQVDSSDITLFIDTGQKTYNQTQADKVNKRDLIINFRKPKSGESRLTVSFDGVEDEHTFLEKARAVIREFLEKNPGSTKDRIYDELVSRMVRKGEIEAHDFESLLREVAEEVARPVRKDLLENEPPNLLGTHQIARWYLRETETGADQAEQVTADAAAARIHNFLLQTTTARLKDSESTLTKLTAEQARIRERLQDVDRGVRVESRGKLVRDLREISNRIDKLEFQRAEWLHQALHYSDLFEFYVTRVNPKPRATLEELLEDYCYQTDAGNWRPPLTDEEKKEKSGERQRAVRRQIQRLYKLLESGQAVPESLRADTPTLVEWIRHCRRTGLHSQGKLLYEQGGLDLNSLTEEEQVDVEEDYQVCVRAIQNR